MTEFSAFSGKKLSWGLNLCPQLYSTPKKLPQEQQEYSKTNAYSFFLSASEGGLVKLEPTLKCLALYSVSDLSLRIGLLY